MSNAAKGLSHSLRRTFRPEWVFAMALGSAIGWGAFILPFGWLESSGIGGVTLGFTIGGLIIGVIAVNYGVVVRALPVTGGALAFALSTLGRTHGYIAGWALTLGYAAIVALNASAVTLIFRVTIPDLVMWGRLYTVASWDVYLPEIIIASTFILGFAYLNTRGVEMSGRLQFHAVVIMLGAVLLLLLTTSGQALAHITTMPALMPQDVSTVAAIAVILAFVPWAYVGFDSVPQLAGEFDFPPQKAMSLLIWGVIMATFVYISMTYATAFAVGTNWTAYEGSSWPTAEAISAATGNFGLILMVVAVSMGVLTGLNGFFVASSRVLLTMGRAEMLPARFGSLDPRWRSPRTAILLVAVLCLITPWFGRATLSWVVDMTSVGITVAYFYTSYCAFRIGATGFVCGMKQKIETNRRTSLFGILGCVFSVGFLGLLLVPTSPGSLSAPSLIALGVWTLLGVGVYTVRRPFILALDDAKLKKIIFQQ